jgi:hypothetical protein
MVLLTAGLLATLWLAITAVSGSYQLQRTQAEISSLNEQKEKLLRQNSVMDSPPALRQRAIDQGMRPAPPPAYLVPRPDGSVGVLGDPTALGTPGSTRQATSGVEGR